MKTKAREVAEQLVDDLFNDMDDRSFDTGGVDPDVLAEWKEAWTVKILTALVDPDHREAP